MKQVEIDMIKSMSKSELKRAIVGNEICARQYKIEGLTKLYNKRIDKIAYLEQELKLRKQ